jgi:ketosteroid isomerase-like protein
MEHKLIMLENQIAQAVVQGDTAFMERVWDDDFFYTGVRGALKTKKDVLAEIRSGDLKFELMQFDDFRVRVYGETALVTGRATTKGRGHSGEITGRFRYTRLYVKRQGQWRLVAFQVIPIAGPPAR